MMNNEELGLDFETGKVTRGDVEIMNLEELLFLLDSAVQYNSFNPIPESEEFVADLRERVGLGFTKEQFQEMKEYVKQFNSNEEE